MSLTLLVAMVVVGISAIVIAVHLSGGTTTAKLESADAARQRFAHDFADIEVGNVWITEQGHAAFLALKDGRAGIVSALGDRFLTRIVSPDETGLRADRDGNTVRLMLSDMTWHGGPFSFASEKDAEAVAGLLGASRPCIEGEKVHG